MNDSVQDLALNAPQRRILGVLIEKALTTPQQYPLSLNATVSGCNQSSNRAPITHYTEDEVEGHLEELRARRLATVILPHTGRVNRWKQELVTVLGLNRAELAVLGELLLRGAQSEGDLRARASRMQPIAGLSELREILTKLSEMTPPLVMRLSSPEMQRGVRWTHLLFPPNQLEDLRAEEAEGAPQSPSSASPKGPSSNAKPAHEARIEALESKVAELGERLEKLERDLS